MRISDWSSDVCSSDLLAISAIAGVMNHEDCASGICPPPSSRAEAIHEQEVVEHRRVEGALEQAVRFVVARPNDCGAASVKAWKHDPDCRNQIQSGESLHERAEEHRAEIQSIM